MTLKKSLYHGFAVLFLLGTQLAVASPKFQKEPVAVFTGADAGHWTRVELLRDNHPAFHQESFAPYGKKFDPSIVKWFGSDTPNSRDFLLHCILPNNPTEKVPVLLVTGASDTANRAWIHPWNVDNFPTEIPKDRQGFAQGLAEAGYQVCAISFAHSQGDNYMQTEHVANAIARMKVLLKRQSDDDFKVDIIAHSKGAVVSRMYCSDAASIFPEQKMLTHFRNDVRILLTLALPLKGVDSIFRYYTYNVSLATQAQKLNAPLGPDKLLLRGLWENTSEHGVFPDGGNYYPGQAQLLYNLVRDGGVPLGVESATMDFNMTRDALYYGGTTMFLSSRGIDEAIKSGGSMMYKIEKVGVDPSVSLSLITGDDPHVTYSPDGSQVIPMPWEDFAPPGDGVVFLASSHATKGILSRGAPLLGLKTVHYNHLELGRQPAMLNMIKKILKKGPAQ